MRPNMKKFLVVLSVAAISCVTIAGCGADNTAAPEQAASSDVETETETEAETEAAETETETEAETEAAEIEKEAEAQSEAAQLTLEDIRQMNGGDIRYNTNDEGNITFLAGKFYDGKIEDGDDVLRALEGVSTLIGADESTAYEKGDAVQDDNGYTYYTLRQWHGETEVLGSIVKIIVSPDQEAVAVSSSVQPGVDAGTELVISPEEAVEAARAHLAQTSPQVSYTFYPEQVDKTTLSYTVCHQ